MNPPPQAMSMAGTLAFMSAPGVLKTQYLNENGQTEMHADQVYEAFAIDTDKWEKYKQGVKNCYVCTTPGRGFKGNVDLPDMICNVPWCHGLIFCPILFGPCLITACAQQYCCCVVKDRELPTFNEEALILTTAGIKGYKRTLEGCECCPTEEKWEPAALTWEGAEIGSAEIKRTYPCGSTTSSCCCPPPDAPKDQGMLSTHVDKELTCNLGFGLLCPFGCHRIACCSQHIPGYYAISIPSKAGSWHGNSDSRRWVPNSILTARALHEDADRVMELINQHAKTHIKSVGK